MTNTSSQQVDAALIKDLANYPFHMLDDILYSVPEKNRNIIKAAIVKYKAKRSPLEFAEYASGGEWKSAPHFELLNSVFMDACKNQRFIIINLPVRHGKSEFTSMYALAWYLGRFPNKRIILCSYSLDSSQRLSTNVRNIFKAHSEDIFDGLKISTDTASKKRFNINNHSGGLMATAVGATIIGYGANLVIMDDLYKDFAMASSAKYEQDLRDWWLNTVRSRLEPGASVILVLARWNDDISGWLMDQAKSVPGFDQWIQVKLEAICENPEEDPLGREYGEALWPDRWPVQSLLPMKRTSPAIWPCQYQQRAVDFSSSLFQPKNWNYISLGKLKEEVKLKHVIRAWDLSAGGEGSDFLSGVLMGIDNSGMLYILDVKSKKFTSSSAQLDIKNYLRSTAEFDRELYNDKVIIRFEQAPGAGKSVAEEHVRVTFAGFDVAAVPKTGADKSKVANAIPLSAQQQAGSCFILHKSTDQGEISNYEWTANYLMQMAIFPGGENDDVVDASSLAYNILSKLFHEQKDTEGHISIIRPNPNKAQQVSKGPEIIDEKYLKRRRGRIISLQD